MSSGCGRLNEGPPVKGGITVGRDCERLAAEVPAPGISEGGDVFVSIAEHRVALGQANGNLRATRTCQINQRKRLSGGR